MDKNKILTIIGVICGILLVVFGLYFVFSA